jgi:hypothetical protein
VGRGLSDAVVISPLGHPGDRLRVDETTLILLISAGRLLYTALGGMRAVMWVEAWQMMIIFLGILFCLGRWSGLPGYLSWRRSRSRAPPVDEDGGLHSRSVGDLHVLERRRGGIFLMLSYFGCDQSQVQRYLTGASHREPPFSPVQRHAQDRCSS